MTITLYRAATVIDVPHDPFALGPGDAGSTALRVEHETSLAVDADGRIAARAPYSELADRFPDADVVDLDGYLLPGLVDTHVHLPQIRALGGIGLPLLDWLRRLALPAEEAMAETTHAGAVVGETLRSLAASGTTSALVFGSHFPAAMDLFFAEAARSGLRISSGLVVSDTNLTDRLHTDAARAFSDSLELAHRWHGAAHGRLTYAVTPRFALSCTASMLHACHDVLVAAPGVMLTSHVNENPDEIAGVSELHPRSSSYTGVYADHGLLDGRSVLAHDVHPGREELDIMAQHRAAVAHCPTSNAALRSGLFPFGWHVEHGVQVGLGSDVGAGGGFGILKEALQAVYLQQLLRTTTRHRDSYNLSPTHALWTATRAGAMMLGQDGGILEVGRPFDAVLLRPPPGSDTQVALDWATDETHLLAALLTLAQRHDVQVTWVDGRVVHGSTHTDHLSETGCLT